jgi:hypothetical protein
VCKQYSENIQLYCTEQMAEKEANRKQKQVKKTVIIKE